MPTQSEQIVITQNEKEGWKVKHCGYPDLICTRGNETKFVEVKSGSDKLRLDQSDVLNILRKLGLKTELDIVDEIAGTITIVKIEPQKQPQPQLQSQSQPLRFTTSQNLIVRIKEIFGFKTKTILTVCNRCNYHWKNIESACPRCSNIGIRFVMSE